MHELAMGAGMLRLWPAEYNEAAWEVEGKYWYPEFKTLEEYMVARAEYLEERNVSRDGDAPG